MTFQVLGKTKDQRSGANVIYCKCSINEYLEIIGSDFENFTIQRKKENHKAYQRLKDDLKDGALLPSITLAVKHHRVTDVLSLINDDDALSRILCGQGIVDILDGLQRTYIINELKESGCEFKAEQELLLEYWIEEDISKLIYRMIVLNAGQKAMSMRHQIELLFMSLKETVCEEIEDIEIFVERDVQRRTASNKYSLGNIASAYQAYMTKTTELDKANIVAQELSRENIMDSPEEELTARFNEFISLFKIVKEIDGLAWSYYCSSFDDDRYNILKGIEPDVLDEDDLAEYDDLRALKKAHSWLGNENVMLALFCAISIYKGTPKEDRVLTAFNRLKDRLSNNDNDPLGITKYERIRGGINPRKSNVGFATRKLLLNGFKEFFRDDGDTEMSVCWELATD